MPLLTGYNPGVKTDAILDTGVIFVNGRPWAATKGEPTIAPKKTVVGIEFDGKKAMRVKGLDRIVDHGLEITATLIQFGADMAQKLDVGAALHTAVLADVTADAALATPTGLQVGDKTVTPHDAGSTLPDAAYVENMIVWFRRAAVGGGFVGFRIPVALVTEYSVKSANKGQGEFPVKIEACVDATDPDANLDAAPYDIIYRAALPPAPALVP